MINEEKLKSIKGLKMGETKMNSKNQLKVDKELRKALKIIIEYTSLDVPRPVFNEVFYDATEQAFIATDGRAIVVYNYPTQITEDITFESSFLKDILKLKLDGVINCENNHYKFVTEKLYIEGNAYYKFPNWRKVIPNDENLYEVPIQDCISKVLNSESFRKKIGGVYFSTDEIILGCNTDNPIKLHQSAPTEITLNARYLDLISKIKNYKFKRQQSNFSAVTFSNDKIKVTVMPMVCKGEL